MDASFARAMATVAAAEAAAAAEVEAMRAAMKEVQDLPLFSGTPAAAPVAKPSRKSSLRRAA